MTHWYRPAPWQGLPAEWRFTRWEDVPSELRYSDCRICGKPWSDHP